MDEMLKLRGAQQKQRDQKHFRKYHSTFITRVAKMRKNMFCQSGQLQPSLKAEYMLAMCLRVSLHQEHDSPGRRMGCKQRDKGGISMDAMTISNNMKVKSE
ncbi:hypothetical protein K443DRAFT_124698 [Laccaria amethystina LaAM-08-1]|uniref:Uncharacterized protein n=1 Tax=Laccaria amethystina LaAM-08-1 TaxID=1095629 RepID=A0A0C9WK47_9AGAR|nr:hypothetical protein K443DRAFT_124698 [Laccaria amethystina LaAM-08-1]